MEKIDRSYSLFTSNIENFKKYAQEPISETDTRCKIIDILLKDILGWTEDDIERERFVQVGYFDYEVSTSTFKFVIEAKKTFIEFNLPEKGRKVKLRTIYKGNKEVIDQIRSYIFQRSLLYGIITNGRQFIIGKFNNTDGTDWQENDVLFYQSIEAIDKDFIRFYETLSKDYVSHYGRFKLFVESNEGKTIVRSNNLKRKDEELIRNKNSAELIPIITGVFEEIYRIEDLNDKKILEECYVKNEDVKKYNSELGFIFSDDPPTFDSRITPVQNTESTQKQIQDKILESNNKLPDPIIIIGGKGAGKTTFIKYFTDIILDKKIKKNRPILYLDFRDETEDSVRNTPLIYKKLIRQLNDLYPEIKAKSNPHFKNYL